jgi:hypothetical protein
MNAFNVPNRDKQHGGLEPVGIVSQQMKAAMRESPNWASLSLHPAGREALDMIVHKIARILSGSDPDDSQHWEDIAGYAIAFMRTWSELHSDEDDECKDGFCPMPNVRLRPSESMFPPVKQH